jgi:hypothetical protein
MRMSPEYEAALEVKEAISDLKWELSAAPHIQTGSRIWLWVKGEGGASLGMALVVNGLGITFLPDGARGSEFFPWTSVSHTGTIDPEEDA